MHPGEIARHAPDKPAIVLGDRRVGYAALDAASRRLAVLARDEGLARGDVLAILAPNGPEFLAAAWAAQRSGLYALPLGARLTAEDLDYILRDSGARLVFTTSDTQALASQALGKGDSARCLCLSTLTDLFEPSAAPADPDPVEGGDMLYTSGTTGRPKGVRRPLAFTALGSDVSRVQRLQELFYFDRDSVFLSPAPLYHAAPLRFSMAVLRLGGTLVLQAKFDPEAALMLLDREAVTHSQWVPTMFRRLLALPPEVRSRVQARAHRVAIHAGAPCPVDLKRQMIAWWGPILHEYYSGTESIGFTHLNSEEWLAHPGSVGRPWRCAVHILDDDGRPCDPGAIGNVFFSGREPLRYHGDPEKSAAAVSAQGYATMGDIGYVDDAGYLFLTDRKAFTIISGGVNIYPREIEAALQRDARVCEVAVFGAPDDDLGEAVIAIVQLTPDASADLATACELRVGLERSLARFKLPRTIAFIPQLPLTDSGKIHKALLRDTWRSASTAVFDYDHLTGANACAMS